MKLFYEMAAEALLTNVGQQIQEQSQSTSASRDNFYAESWQHKQKWRASSASLYNVERDNHQTGKAVNKFMKSTAKMSCEFLFRGVLWILPFQGKIFGFCGVKFSYLM